jgi:hypothetical protein
VTDYNYDHQKPVDFSDTDRNANRAQDVDRGTYALTVTPQANWPGLDAHPKQVRFNSDQMVDVAKWLEEQADQLADLPQQVNTNLVGVKFGPEHWPPAKYLGRANDQVKAAVSKYSQELVQNLKEAAASIRAAAGANQRADDTSATTSHNQSAQL